MKSNNLISWNIRNLQVFDNTDTTKLQLSLDEISDHYVNGSNNNIVDVTDIHAVNVDAGYVIKTQRL